MLFVIKRAGRRLGEVDDGKSRMLHEALMVSHVQRLHDGRDHLPWHGNVLDSGRVKFEEMAWHEISKVSIEPKIV